MSNQISIQSTINSDISKVWEGYTKPEHITKWNFASPEWYSPKAENDLKPGGMFNYRMEAKDGSYGFDFEGKYNEIIQNQLIAYTLLDGREVRVKFKPNEGQTVVTINFDPEKENSIELQKQGWQAILDNFKKYVENSF